MILRFLILMFLFMSPVTLSRQQPRAVNPNKHVDNLEATVDSLDVHLQRLLTSLRTTHSSDSVQLTQELQKHRKELVDLLSTAVSISSSNVGNTVNFLALIFTIIGVILVVFAGAGYFYIDNHLKKVTQRYETKFDEKAKVLEVSVEESRANFFLIVGQYQPASEVFEKILTLDPDSFIAHEKLGFLYLGDTLGKPERAVYHNREAIKLRPNELFPYVNLQVALEHAKHPLGEIEQAFNQVIQMSNLLGADEMTFGKAKLFFAGILITLDPSRKQDAARLNQEAMAHFSRVGEPSRANERIRWTSQAQQNMQKLTS